MQLLSFFISPDVVSLSREKSRFSCNPIKKSSEVKCGILVNLQIYVIRSNALKTLFISCDERYLLYDQKLESYI